LSWLQLRLPCHRAAAEAIEDALLGAGALSVTLEDAGDQPLLEPRVGETPLWRELQVTGLFRADADLQGIHDAIEHVAGGVSPQLEILEDRDWTREWMRNYRPMRFGQRLWICPSWLEPPDPQAVNLLLDPGLAFGTGTHPTTALCLEALDALPLAGRSVVDYGCGSGILAIAAARLGAARLLAVDNDPQALAASADNAQRNGVDSSTLHICQPGAYDASTWRARADVVIANILAGPLEELRDTLCDLLAPGGTLLLAGLLDTQMQALAAHYAPRIALAERGRRDEWVCLEGRLPQAG
jgi:ribosomal protein L11 methyltransferase